MKKFIFLLFMLGLISATDTKAQCNEELVKMATAELKNSTYLKDFRIRLKKAEKNKPAPVARYSVYLNKGTHYRFSICNSPDFEGKAIMQLFDSDVLLGSTYNADTKKDYFAFDFMCSKSASYQILATFQEGKEGCAVGILSMVKDKK